MKKSIHYIMRRLTAWLQSSKGSYKRHNNQYEESEKLEEERAHGQKLIKDNAVNGPEMRAKDLLIKYPGTQVVVDIGSGAGWCSASLSPLVEEVIAIEPSQAAIKISKELYPTKKYPNIQWVEGFAETELKKINLRKPTMFFTGCVLSHIRDKEVIKICEAVNSIASKDSILTFAECWGEKPWHQLMWHVRTKNWWQEQLPDWELTFHGPQVTEKDEYKGTYHKGFWGIKKA